VFPLSPVFLPFLDEFQTDVFQKSVSRKKFLKVFSFKKAVPGNRQLIFLAPKKCFLFQSENPKNVWRHFKKSSDTSTSCWWANTIKPTVEWGWTARLAIARQKVE
jgi:hypothetical protein